MRLNYRLKTIFTLTTIITVGTWLTACGKNKEDQSNKALVTAIQGTVKENERLLQNGDLLQAGATIRTMSNSWCELSIRTANSTVTLRLAPESSFVINELDLKKQRRANGNLIQGKGFFSPRLSNGEHYNIKTPTAVASVRGTDYIIKVESEKQTELIVTSGTVIYRSNLPELDDYPSEFIDKSEEMQAALTSLEKSAQPVNAGEKAVLTEQDSNQKREQLKTLNQLLEQENVSRLKGKKEASSAEIDAAINSLNTSAQESETSAKLKRELAELATAPSVKSEKLSEEELQNNIDYFKPITDSSTSNLNETLSIENKIEQVEKVIKENKNVKMEEIETIIGKKEESIKLKNGKTLTGVIIQSGSDFIILSPKGKKVVSINELAEIKF